MLHNFISISKKVLFDKRKQSVDYKLRMGHFLSDFDEFDFRYTLTAAILNFSKRSTFTACYQFDMITIDPKAI